MYFSDCKRSHFFRFVFLLMKDSQKQLYLTVSVFFQLYLTQCWKEGDRISGSMKVFIFCQERSDGVEPKLQVQVLTLSFTSFLICKMRTIIFTSKQTFSKLYLLLLFLVPLRSEIYNCDISFTSLPSQINGTLSPSIVYLVQVEPIHVGRFFFKTDVDIDSISFKISVWARTKNASDDLYQVYLLGETLQMGYFSGNGRHIQGYEVTTLQSQFTVPKSLCVFGN